MGSVYSLMSLFLCRQSLRDIQSNLGCQQEKTESFRAKSIPFEVTLARINEQQPALYQQLFSSCLNTYEQQKVAHKFRFKNPLYSLDAHIDLSLSLCEWAKVHDSKASMKLSIGLNHSNDIPEFVAVEKKKMTWYKVLQFQFPAGSIVVLIKAMSITNGMQILTTQNIGFVTRFRPKSVYQVIQQHPVLESKGILKDETIQLNSAICPKRKNPVLRRIEYRDQQSGKL